MLNLNLEGRIQECRCTTPGNLEREAFCIVEIYGIVVKMLWNYLKLNDNSILSLKSCFSCTILQWCLYSSDPEAFSVCPLSEYTNKWIKWFTWCLLCRRDVVVCSVHYAFLLRCVCGSHFVWLCAFGFCSLLSITLVFSWLQQHWPDVSYTAVLSDHRSHTCIIYGYKYNVCAHAKCKPLLSLAPDPTICTSWLWG